MPKQPYPDNLARLGDMLTADGEYSDCCDGTLLADSRDEVEGAYHRVDTLRVHHAELSQKIDALELRLHARLREFTHL
jgi:hypothetical protein